MTTRDADPLAKMQAKRLQFDRYVLDLDRGCLLLDGNEIALRPKTFAVLKHLIENSGRLVSKDELFAAAWPNLAVTDDALVQSIGELRRALGDDGQRLIRTVPRRGYRLESYVSIVAPVDSFATDGRSVSAVSRDEADSPELTIRAHALTAFATGLRDWRRGWFAALALVALLAAGALLVARSEWRFLSFLRSGDQLIKNAEIGAKPAIAVLPFLNQGDD